jgi:hypothetical protein
MNERGRNILQQFKNTPSIVIVAAVLLIVGAFGAGFAVGGDDSNDGSERAGHQGMPFKGGPGGPGSMHGNGRGQFPNDQVEKFHDCLSDEGVERPTPGEQPSQSEIKKLRSAAQKCKKYLPGGGPGYR